MKKLFRPELLKAKMIIKNVNAALLSDKIGVDISTFYRKLNGESEFNRTEMQIIRNELSLNKDDMDSIFFSE